MVVFLFLFVIQLPLGTVASDGIQCGGPGGLPVEGGVIRASQDQKPMKHYYSARQGPNPDAMIPFNIFFIPDPNIKRRKSLDGMTKLGYSVNKRLRAAIKAHPLNDVRLPVEIIGRINTSNNMTINITNNISDQFPLICKEPRCYDDYFPTKLHRFVQPCEEGNISRALLPDLYTLVVFWFVVGDGAGKFKECDVNQKVLFGAHCREDIWGRPTHGRLLWCGNPEGSPDEVSLVLHEVLHIITGYSLVGLGNPLINCSASNTEAEPCKDKTWKTVTIDWEEHENKVSKRDHRFAITPSVWQAAKEFFNCSTVEGAQLNNIQNRFGLGDQKKFLAIGDMYGHWNFRLFHDEILSPIISPNMRMSSLTLAALNDTLWYDVNMSFAEPLLGRPKQLGCDVAMKSCTTVIRNITETGSRKDLKLVAPYCNDDFEVGILQSYCTTDGKTRLACKYHHDKSEINTEHCSIIVEAEKGESYSYDLAVCEIATTQPVEASLLGGMYGPRSICTTFASIPKFEYKTKSEIMRGSGALVMCAERDCNNERQTVIVYLTPGKTVCKYNCTQDQAGRVIDFSQGGECGKLLGDVVSIVCPDYIEVCANYKPFPKDPVFEPPACATPPVSTPTSLGTPCPICPTSSCKEESVKPPLGRDHTPGTTSPGNSPMKPEAVITSLGFMLSLVFG